MSEIFNSLQLEHWDIERLMPYARNPRKNDDVVPRMMEAIQEFGFRVPILVNKNTGEVVDGHLRLKAAKELGLKTVPVTFADGMSKTQIKAFRVLANQSANWADWDDELLKIELLELDNIGYDVDMIGFSSRELDKVMRDADLNNAPDEFDLTDEKPLAHICPRCGFEFE